MSRCRLMELLARPKSLARKIRVTVDPTEEAVLRWLPLPSDVSAPVSPAASVGPVMVVVAVAVLVPWSVDSENPGLSMP